MAILKEKTHKTEFDKDDFIVIAKSLLPIREDAIIDRIYKRSK